MAELEKVIKGLECCLNTGNFEECTENCPYFSKKLGLGVCSENMQRDALSLLKAQELPDVKPEKLEERTTKWLDQMTSEERLKVIAAILDDWDGYRTAKGLGGLINEVWAYALYPVKAQEPRVMPAEELRQYLMINERGLLHRDQWQELGQRAPLYIEFRRPDEFQVNWRTAESLRPWAMESMFWDGYNKDRRCWTSRPTNEQRKAVKWDG